MKRQAGFSILLAMSAFFAGLLLCAPSAQASDAKGKVGVLYVESVGIAYAPNVQPDLPSCEKDAKDIVAWAVGQRGKLANEVRTSLRIDQEGTAANILNGLKALREKVKPSDYVIVYLSGHGGLNPVTGEFHFVAYDRRVRWSELQPVLRSLPGTVIVILDACHSGGVRSENTIVFSACLKDQTTAGFTSNKVNSICTKYLLEGMNGQADLNRDNIVTLSEIEAFVSNQLVAWNKSNPRQNFSVTRPGNVPSDLPVARLSSVGPAVNPVPVAPVLGVQLTGTTWKGSKGSDELVFRFGLTTVTVNEFNIGTYTFDGTTVTLRFPDATYVGTTEGHVMTGTLGTQGWIVTRVK
jgi:hypothetical protein